MPRTPSKVRLKASAPRSGKANAKAKASPRATSRVKPRASVRAGSPAPKDSKASSPKASSTKAPAGKPASRKGSIDPTPIDALTHSATRANIPTEDLRDFYHEANPEPAAPMLYPRDTTLDPQLVWKGKDEQDREGLSIPTVPIYIQEKIHPRAIIEDFKASVPSAKAQDDGPGLFADHYAAFNGLPKDFADRVDFYNHQGHWQNRMILGDSLLVMNSLAEKEAMKGRVQCIYFDPPYGIKFGSNWQVSTRKRDVKDGKAEDVVRQPEQMRAFRDTWELGIHSYLSYLRDRLVVARELLNESGSIFVQIGDENVHLVRSVMDEVFGSENFHALIISRKTSPLGTAGLSGVTDYVLWYARSAEQMKYRPLYVEKEIGGGGRYSWVQLPNGMRRRMTSTERENVLGLSEGSRVFVADKATSAGLTPSCVFSIDFEGKSYVPHPSSSWSSNKLGMEKLKVAGRLIAPADNLSFVRFHDDFPVQSLYNLWDDTTTGGFNDPKIYVVQTVTKVVERCLLMTTDPGDLVLDPTCGSGTTAYVAEQWGRRWITTDTSRVALTLARTRLMAAKFPSYYLADQYPQVAQSTDDAAIKHHLRTANAAMPPEKANLSKGFVYKRVPHVTLKSIANNPDIKEGMTRAEIDRAIAKHAETETLYDKPYENDKAVRVCGPFTVESLSPHRQLSVHTKRARAEEGIVQDEGAITGVVGIKVHGPDDFGRMILDNLKRAGVQNTYKNERMQFDSLDPWPGQWIHGSGSYADKQGKPVRVAVCIGPEHGTVGAELIKEAAKEAVRGVGFDTLIVAGFAFDPSVSEEAKRYGNLVVLPVRINADIAMDGLLKKTGAGNLFMIFGEPDLAVLPAKDEDGKPAVQVELRGLDVYDPTSGEVRSSSTDDIACWFIDTNYNGEAFFVRHAYFTGSGSEKGEGPYDKLKRALKADIDEGAWSALYSTTSRPFAKPTTGKIAVKVINHYGDEVLHVYPVK
jgi:adenine-specific DNA-methyltransferase